MEQMQRQIANFANTAVAAGTILEQPTTLFANIFTAVNETTKLRWVNIAPYGDWPNSQGMQRIQKADAVKMVNEFNSLIATPRKLLGLPWYIGHPDHPNFANKYKDTKSYGRIKQLEARDDGLYAGVKMNEDGEKILTNESFDGHSVNWYLKEDPKQKNVWRPFRVKSVGWTNEPNIPVPTMTTANEDLNGKLPVIFANGSDLQKAHFANIAGYRTMANADRDGHPFRGNQCTAVAEGISGSSLSNEDKSKLTKSFSDSFASNPSFKADKFADHVSSSKQTGAFGDSSTTMRRAHFDHIASVIKSSDISAGAKENIAQHFSHKLALINPNFNHNAFVAAASGQGYKFKSRTPISKAATNERYQHIAAFRMIANAGTSDGAVAGWETRHGSAGMAKYSAEYASDRAEKSAAAADNTPSGFNVNAAIADHAAAADKHGQAVSVFQKLGNKAEAELHQIKAYYHNAQAQGRMLQAFRETNTGYEDPSKDEEKFQTAAGAAAQ